jgi:hypothetical protein
VAHPPRHPLVLGHPAADPPASQPPPTAGTATISRRRPSVARRTSPRPLGRGTRPLTYALRQRSRLSVALVLQTMTVPVSVTPGAPAVEQNAPGCTVPIVEVRALVRDAAGGAAFGAGAATVTRPAVTRGTDTVLSAVFAAVCTDVLADVVDAAADDEARADVDELVGVGDGLDANVLGSRGLACGSPAAARSPQLVVTDRMLIFGERHLRRVLAGYAVQLQHRAAASCVAVATAAPNIAGSRAGPWQDPAATDLGRAPQRVRGGSLKPLVQEPSHVLEPTRPWGARRRGRAPGSTENVDPLRTSGRSSADPIVHCGWRRASPDGRQYR